MNLRLALALAFLLPLALACGDDHDEESFDNLEDCAADHAGLGEAEAVAHCLVDFPDLHPEFEDAEDCEAWVSDNGFSDVATEACEDYFAEI
jgi:hypothetical protein